MYIKKKHSFHTYKKMIYGFFMKYVNSLRYGYWGNKSIIYKPFKVTGKKHIYIGNSVFFDQGLRMEAITHKGAYKYCPRIYINDFMHAEQHCQIFCANSVKIGKHVVISSDVFITDVEHEYNSIQSGILEQKLKIGSTKIGDYAFLGVGVKIIKGVTIGKHAVIGANSVVTKDIPAYCVAVGIPARVIKKYNPSTQKWENIQ